MKSNNRTKQLLLGSAIAAFGICTSLYAGETSVMASSKEVKVVEEKKASPFTTSLTIAYDSEYIFRGVNILDATVGSADFANVDFNLSAYGFTAGAWYGNAVNKTNKDLKYSELDLYLAYTYALGPVNLTGGYTFYYFPDSGDTYSHEVNVGISTSAIPFVTPSLFFYYDLNEKDDDVYDGGYLEFKLQSSIPIVADKLSIDPYGLISYDFQYNSNQQDFNNVQVGVSIPYHVTKNITISANAHYSWALSAIEDFQDDEAWGGAKLNFTF